MAGRRSSFGQLDKLPSGRWRARYVWPPASKTLHAAPTTFQTRKDAQAWLTDEHRLIERDEWTPPKTRAAAKYSQGQTLRTFAPTWLASHRKRGSSEPLEDRTREHYGYLLEKRIYPELGDLPMHQIDTDVMTAWRDGLPATPVANAHAYALLREILTAAAVKDRRITPPSLPGASKAKTKHEAEPATVAELNTIVANMPERYRLAILLMAWCALRFGETAELRRQDIDLRRNKIRVRRGVIRVEGQRKVKTTKSEAGLRDVTIPPHLLPVIKEHLKEHAQPGPSGLLFASAKDANVQVSQSTLNGKPARRRIIKGRIINESATGFCRAREAAGRPDLTLHDLRHTGGTLAAQTGATLAELMARLGHATPQAAMRYQHAARGRDAAIAEALSEIAKGRAV